MSTWSRASRICLPPLQSQPKRKPGNMEHLRHRGHLSNCPRSQLWGQLQAGFIRPWNTSLARHCLSRQLGFQKVYPRYQYFLLAVHKIAFPSTGLASNNLRPWRIRSQRGEAVRIDRFFLEVPEICRSGNPGETKKFPLLKHHTTVFNVEQCSRHRHANWADRSLERTITRLKPLNSLKICRSDRSW